MHDMSQDTTMYHNKRSLSQAIIKLTDRYNRNGRAKLSYLILCTHEFSLREDEPKFSLFVQNPNSNIKQKYDLFIGFLEVNTSLIIYRNQHEATCITFYLSYVDIKQRRMN